MKNNRVELVGKIAGKPKLSHITKWEVFYYIYLDVVRRSGYVDQIPVMVSEHMLSAEYEPGICVKVTGTYRSYNNAGKLELFVFADNLERIDPSEDGSNEVELHGFICKPPIYRQTPGGREITDICLAVNREAFGRSYYIPLVVWGRVARCLANKQVGIELTVHGRIQSRKYMKVLGEEQIEMRTAYEVSVNSVSIGPKEE